MHPLIADQLARQLVNERVRAAGPRGEDDGRVEPARRHAPALVNAQANAFRGALDRTARCRCHNSELVAPEDAQLQGASGRRYSGRARLKARVGVLQAGCNRAARACAP